MTITHIFFDLHGTLIDGSRLHPCYSAHLGRILAHRYGGTPTAWMGANRRVLADWDSYYADLDLTGEHGIEDMWEGLLRTTRAMFRLVGIPEPDSAALAALSRELPELATQHCNALYSDVRAAVETLHAAGFRLGVTSHAITGQIRGVLQGGALLPYFTGPVVGPDVTGHFQKDALFYRFATQQAQAAPEECLAIDDTGECLLGARAAGMRTIQLARRSAPDQSPADALVVGGLEGVLGAVNRMEHMEHL